MELSGRWNKQGDFVVPVPVGVRATINAVWVEGARSRVLQINPAACYVVIPGKGVPKPDEWRVSVEEGALKVRPPRRRSSGGGSQTNYIGSGAVVGMIVGEVRGNLYMGPGGMFATPSVPTIGLVLPRQMRINDGQ